MQPFISLSTLELFSAERRRDPRLIAAAGYPAPSPKRNPRRLIGDLLIRIGQWIAGTHLEHIPAGAPSGA